MVTNNIGQVAHLNAKLYKTSRIYFVGTFLQHNIISQQRLAYSIDYWSQGKMEALFLEHEAYFGALGAFLLNHGIEHKKQAVSPTKSRKRRQSKANPTHQRSKSMGSIQFQL
jgi:pantothenate kinase